MEHLSAEISSNGNIILWRQPGSVEVPDKSKFIMLTDELPLSSGYEIFKHFSFCGSKLHTLPFAHNVGLLVEIHYTDIADISLGLAHNEP